MFRRKPKIEYVEVESIKTPELAGHLCKEAARHFGALAAKERAYGRTARAEVFDEARDYFLPQAWTIGLDGEMHFLKPSIGETSHGRI